MILPTQDYRKTRIRTLPKVHQGLDGMAHGIVGGWKRLFPAGAAMARQAEKIHDDALQLKHFSDRRLRDRLEEFENLFRRQKTGYQERTAEALTALVEAADRTLGLRPYPVQIMGAMGLYGGYLIEMATGEGKSLTACLSGVLSAWTGRPCHVVTVNDYLAERDAVQMAPFYRYCGVSAGSVTGQMDEENRRINYGKGITYTTSKELAADFLRDRLRLGVLQTPDRVLIRRIIHPQASGQLVMRGMDTAIVDEADSVLVDEAVTPLIISRPQENRPLAEACRNAYEIGEMLVPGTDYKTNIRYREITITDEGLRKIDSRAESLPGLWRGKARRQELVRQSLIAREFYECEKQYVVQDGKVAIVDEFTGRLMANRTWRHGLHQAVEAKEGLEATSPSETLARISFQRFFRFFRKLSGMTGTAREAAGEFWHIYGLTVLPIPTNRPCVRDHLPDAVYASGNEKWEAIHDEISRLHRTGRPILVGTRSVRASERLAEALKERGLEFNLLNAVRHKEEARIVAAAGEPGRITIATNMAGRGTDIKLGRGVAAMGGLHVIATERHESGRIDRQLFGRAARQGDPGSARAFISLDDELVKRFLPALMRKRLCEAVKVRLPASQFLSQKAIARVQNTAQRLAYRQRCNVLKMDTWLEEALSFTGPASAF